jgi:hypothetical protein
MSCILCLQSWLVFFVLAVLGQLIGVIYDSAHFSLNVVGRFDHLLNVLSQRFVGAFLIKLNKELIVFLPQNSKFLDQGIELRMLNEKISDLGLRGSDNWQKWLTVIKSIGSIGRSGSKEPLDSGGHLLRTERMDFGLFFGHFQMINFEI